MAHVDIWVRDDALDMESRDRWDEDAGTDMKDKGHVFSHEDVPFELNEVMFWDDGDLDIYGANLEGNVSFCITIPFDKIFKSFIKDDVASVIAERVEDIHKSLKQIHTVVDQVEHDDY